MKVAILGYAREGRSACQHWNQSGNQLTICDQDPDKQLPDGVSAQLGKDYLEGLDHFDLIVRSAGLNPRLITAANPDAPNILDKVTTSVNEFMQVSPSRNIIGITGTKGKGTTSTLIMKMLEAAGHTVHLGGNIGIAPLDMLQGGIRPDDWVVLELSSFQLTDLKHSPPYAICLMVEEEHLNWHDDMDDYLNAKKQLFAHQAEDNVAVFCATNRYSAAIAQASPGLVIPYMSSPGAEVIEEKKIVIDGQAICDVSEIRLLGKHNWQNVCAALTMVWNITQDVAALHRAITDFMGLPHRLEMVREVDGVHYYNDSFSSAPGATVAALEAIPGHKVMIIGGLDKGLDLNELARSVLMHQKEIRRVIIIGEIGPRLVTTLQAHAFTNFDILKHVAITDIVKHARETAQSGDKVVFSPGTSSFDMFKDFEDRGLKYKDAVNAL